MAPCNRIHTEIYKGTAWVLGRLAGTAGCSTAGAAYNQGGLQLLGFGLFALDHADHLVHQVLACNYGVLLDRG